MVHRPFLDLTSILDHEYGPYESPRVSAGEICELFERGPTIHYRGVVLLHVVLTEAIRMCCRVSE